MKKSELKEIIKECYEELLTEKVSKKAFATLAINAVGKLINIVDSESMIATLNDIQNTLRKIERELPR